MGYFVNLSETLINNALYLDAYMFITCTICSPHWFKSLFNESYSRLKLTRSRGEGAGKRNCASRQEKNKRKEREENFGRKEGKTSLKGDFIFSHQKNSFFKVEFKGHLKLNI